MARSVDKTTGRQSGRVCIAGGGGGGWHSLLLRKDLHTLEHGARDVGVEVLANGGAVIGRLRRHREAGLLLLMLRGVLRCSPRRAAAGLWSTTTTTTVDSRRVSQWRRRRRACSAPGPGGRGAWCAAVVVVSGERVRCGGLLGRGCEVVLAGWLTGGFEGGDDWASCWALALYYRRRKNLAHQRGGERGREKGEGEEVKVKGEEVMSERASNSSKLGYG